MSPRVKVVQNHTPINTKAIIKSNNTAKSDIGEWNNSRKIAPQYVRKKWQLVKFKRLIKKGGFTTARLTAQTLGVDKRTIEKWLRLPVIQKALISDINNFTKNIRKSKDWKAHAYLLEQATALNDKETTTNDLKQVIVINT